MVLIFILFSVKIMVNEASIVQIILLWIAELQLDKASANPGTFFFVFSQFYLDLIINSMVSTTLTSVFMWSFIALRTCWHICQITISRSSLCYFINYIFLHVKLCCLTMSVCFVSLFLKVTFWFGELSFQFIGLLQAWLWLEMNGCLNSSSAEGRCFGSLQRGKLFHCYIKYNVWRTYTMSKLDASGAKKIPQTPL